MMGRNQEKNLMETKFYKQKDKNKQRQSEEKIKGKHGNRRTVTELLKMSEQHNPSIW